MSNFEFRGVDQVFKNLGAAGDKGKKAVTQALNDSAHHLLAESIKEVPHDIGTLQGTGNVDPAPQRGGALEAKVGYNTEYAARLHEHPEYKYQKGRKGKYLEDPLKRHIKIYETDVSNALKQTF